MQPGSIALANNHAAMVEKRNNKRSGQSASRSGPSPATVAGQGAGANQFSIDTKQKIYQGLGSQGPGQGAAPNAALGTSSKFGISSGFNSTKVRTQRFGVSGT